MAKFNRPLELDEDLLTDQFIRLMDLTIGIKFDGETYLYTANLLRPFQSQVTFTFKRLIPPFDFDFLSNSRTDLLKEMEDAKLRLLTEVGSCNYLGYLVDDLGKAFLYNSGKIMSESIEQAVMVHLASKLKIQGKSPMEVGKQVAKLADEMIDDRCKSIWALVKTFRQHKPLASGIDSDHLKFLDRLLESSFCVISHIEVDISQRLSSKDGSNRNLREAFVRRLLDSYKAYKNRQASSESFIMFMESLVTCFDQVEVKELIRADDTLFRDLNSDDYEDLTEEATKEIGAAFILKTKEIEQRANENEDKLEPTKNDHMWRFDNDEVPVATENIKNLISQHLRRMFETASVFNMKGQLKGQALSECLAFKEHRGYEVSISRHHIAVKKANHVKMAEIGGESQVVTYVAASKTKGKFLLMTQSFPGPDPGNEDRDDDLRFVPTHRFYTLNLDKMIASENLDSRDFMTVEFEFKAMNCNLMNPMQSLSISAAVFVSEYHLLLMVKEANADRLLAFDFTSMFRDLSKTKVLDTVEYDIKTEGILRVKKIESKSKQKSPKNSSSEDSESDDGDYESDSSASNSLGEPHRRIPQMYLRGKSFYALIPEAQSHSLAIFELQGRRLVLKETKSISNLTSITDSEDDSEDTGEYLMDFRIEHICYMENVLQRTAWIDLKEAVCLAILHTDFKIDLYLLDKSKIVACHGLTDQSKYIAALLGNGEGEEVAKRMEKLSQDSTRFKRIRLEWQSVTSSLVMVIPKLLFEDENECQASGDCKKLVAATFTVKM